jgi:predicted enzyme related to lactoylglutathione lyase
MAATAQFLVNIDIDDLDKAIRFYRTAFGLTTGRRFGANAVEMLGGTAPIYLLVKESGTTPTNVNGLLRSYERHWTPVHLDFVVEDIESAIQQALNSGAQLEAPVSTAKWGKLALMADPFGNGFCFVQFVGDGYDAIAE